MSVSKMYELTTRNGSVRICASCAEMALLEAQDAGVVVRSIVEVCDARD